MAKIEIGDYLNTEYKTDDINLKVRFQLGDRLGGGSNAYVDVQIRPDGEIELSAGEGQLVSYNTSSNVLRVRREPSWDDESIIRIAAHAISLGGDTGAVAREVFNIITGKTV